MIKPITPNEKDGRFDGLLFDDAIMCSLGIKSTALSNYKNVN